LKIRIEREEEGADGYRWNTNRVIEVPILPELAQMLDETPPEATGRLVLGNCRLKSALSAQCLSFGKMRSLTAW
jgi:hypothetical protein